MRRSAPCSPTLSRRALLLGAAVAAEAGAAVPARAAGPWDLKALRRPPAAEIGPPKTEAEGGTRVLTHDLYYEGEPWLGKPTRVFACFARPAEPVERKLPAMVLVHGGGGRAFPQWARLWAARGYAAVAMDLAGNGPDGKRLPDGGPDQSHEWKFRRLGEGVRNAWSYHAVAAVIRALSLLRSRPEVDGDRIGITGISWGGYLTCIAMSLEDRFRAAVPVYGCGYLHENSAWIAILNSLPPEERRTWIETFDPSAYLPRCRTPTLWVNGTNDFAYPLDSYQKSYRAVRGPRQLCVTVGMPHGHEAGWARPEIHLFTDSIFRRRELAPGLALVGAPVPQGDRLLAAYNSPSAVQKAELHWTADLERPWQERRWQTKPGSVLGLDSVEAPLPPDRPAVFFLTLTDVRGAVSSTEHVELR